MIIGNFRKRPFRPREQMASRIALLCLFPLLAAGVAAAGQGKPALASITVRRAPLGRKIPKGFAGFSLEVSTLGQGLAVPPKDQQLLGQIHPGEQFAYALGVPGDPNRAYFQFMRNLGPAILRLGGNSQDNTCWDPHAAPRRRARGPEAARPAHSPLCRKPDSAQHRRTGVPGSRRSRRLATDDAGRSPGTACPGRRTRHMPTAR